MVDREVGCKARLELVYQCLFGWIEGVASRSIEISARGWNGTIEGKAQIIAENGDWLDERGLRRGVAR